MTKEELKQRLIELMGDTQLGVNINALTDNFWEQVFADLATNLIASGVTIRERGEWEKKILFPIHYDCSVCGLSVDYKKPFCPHCGADMRGVRDE